MTDRKLLVRNLLTGIGAATLAALVATPVFLSAAEAINDTSTTKLATVALQGPPPPGRVGFEWWNDPEIQKELVLSAEKVRRINDLYNHRNNELSPLVQDFQQQSRELEKMTRDRVVDVNTYSLQVWRVESARARLYESRTIMLYRMFRELTPEQHRKLQDILDRRFNRGGRGDGRAPDAR